MQSETLEKGEQYEFAREWGPFQARFYLLAGLRVVFSLSVRVERLNQTLEGVNFEAKLKKQDKKDYLRKEK